MACKPSSREVEEGDHKFEASQSSVAKPCLRINQEQNDIIIRSIPFSLILIQEEIHHQCLYYISIAIKD